MTAGIAAAKPIAVVIKASAMPGATAARLADPVCAILVNEFIIPQTVPNNPINGPVDPVEAKIVNFDSTKLISFKFFEQ